MIETLDVVEHIIPNAPEHMHDVLARVIMAADVHGIADVGLTEFEADSLRRAELWSGDEFVTKVAIEAEVFSVSLASDFIALINSAFMGNEMFERRDGLAAPCFRLKYVLME